MKRRTTLILIGLLALSSISCNLISRFAGKAKETAEAAVTSVVWMSGHGLLAAGNL